MKISERIQKVPASPIRKLNAFCSRCYERGQKNIIV